MTKKWGPGNPLYDWKMRNSRRSRLRSSKRRLSMAKTKRTRRRSSSLLSSGLMGTAAGVGGYILFEALIEPKLASFVGSGLTLNLVELAAGAYMAKKGGIVGSIGKAAIVINTYQIMAPFLQSATVQNALPY